MCPHSSPGFSRAKAAAPTIIERIGQGRHELSRIRTLAIEAPSIRAGKIGAQCPHRFADRGEVGKLGHVPPCGATQAATSHVLFLAIDDREAKCECRRG